MYFHRSNRIKTEPRIAGRLDTQFYDNRRKLKIKNIRFSLEHQLPSSDKSLEEGKQIEPGDMYKEREAFLNRKKLLFMEKLPDLPAELRQGKKQSFGQGKNLSVQQHKKKAAFLNSILEILKPNNNNQPDMKNPLEKNDLKELKKDYFMKIQMRPKEYSNEFFDEATPLVSNKYYRSPKIIDSQILKFNNSSSIARRKIFSQDKYRSKGQQLISESTKQSQDLEKIEILTFANKFPFFKKEENQGA